MTIENNNPLSKKIIYLRENNNISLEELSKSLGISVENLQEIESGKIVEDQKLLENISKVLQVPLSYLTEHQVVDDDSLNYLTRAMEKLSQDDHDELLQFTELLEADIKN